MRHYARLAGAEVRWFVLEINEVRPGKDKNQEQRDREVIVEAATLMGPEADPLLFLKLSYSAGKRSYGQISGTLDLETPPCLDWGRPACQLFQVQTQVSHRFV